VPLDFLASRGSLPREFDDAWLAVLTLALCLVGFLFAFAQGRSQRQMARNSEYDGTTLKYRASHPAVAELVNKATGNQMHFRSLFRRKWIRRNVGKQRERT